MNNFTFFHNVFHENCILKSINSHILVVICSFFEFGTVSTWCIRAKEVKAGLFFQTKCSLLAKTVDYFELDLSSVYAFSNDKSEIVNKKAYLSHDTILSSQDDLHKEAETLKH